MDGCIISRVDTDAQVLKHQAVTIHFADQIKMVLDKIHSKILYLQWTTASNKIRFEKDDPVV